MEIALKILASFLTLLVVIVAVFTILRSMAIVWHDEQAATEYSYRGMALLVGWSATVLCAIGVGIAILVFIWTTTLI